MFAGSGAPVSRRYMQAMGEVGTLFSIVNRTSVSTAAVEWHLYRKPRPGAEGPRQEIFQHQALNVWSGPNAFQTRQEFVEIEQQHIDLTGEGWWVVNRVGNIPMEIWPLRPDRIQVIPSATDFIAGYIYTEPDGTKVPLRREDVIQIRMPNPMDPYRGMGPVQTIMANLNSSAAAAEYNLNFFRNSAQPGGILSVPSDLSDEAFKRLQMQWDEQHRGVRNAYRPAILEGGIEWITNAMTMRDMQMVEMRTVDRDVIREAFGIPKFALGDVDDVNRANAEASDAWFQKELIVPRLERFKQALNHDFLPMFGSTGQGVEFDYDCPVPDDRDATNAERTAQANAFSTLVKAGVEPAYAAELLGMPPIEMSARPAVQASATAGSVPEAVGA